MEKVQIRQTELATQSFDMLRFTDHEVMYRIDDVLSEILRFCKETDSCLIPIVEKPTL